MQLQRFVGKAHLNWFPLISVIYEHKKCSETRKGVIYSSAPRKGHCRTDVGHKSTSILKTDNGRAEPLYGDCFHPQKNKNEWTGIQKDFYLTWHLQSTRRLQCVAQPLHMCRGPSDHLQSQGGHTNCHTCHEVYVPPHSHPCIHGRLPLPFFDPVTAGDSLVNLRALKPVWLC